MTLLKLCYYGNPILRKKTEPIEKVDDEVRQLIKDMIETMLHYKGIGLAAPQVGEGRSLFVSIVAGENDDGTVAYTDPYAVINPKLANPDENQNEMEEGCLSLPNLYVPVIRPDEIDISALDVDGNAWQKRVSGFLARHYMHEIDHLHGVLTIDRLKGKRRAQLESALRLLKKRYK